MITHRKQEKHYSCAAACIAMLGAGCSEADARALAGTTRNGTTMAGVLKAVQTRAYESYLIKLAEQPLDRIVWALELQSGHWPLILSLDFRQGRVGLKSGRKFTGHRYHAVVLWKGKIYDPGEDEVLDVDCLGHLADKGLIIRSYVLINPGL